MQPRVSHNHHYVPEWYQKRFLAFGAAKLHVLDLKPDRVRLPSGKHFTHNEYRQTPTSKCFCAENLYMLRFGTLENDAIEKFFFGSVDQLGTRALEVFSGFDSFTPKITESFRPFLAYLGAQCFRTPRGLEWIRQASHRDRQSVLLLLTRMFEAHCTMWAEAVWEIVRADKTKTKFIISDSPISFYNIPCSPHLSGSTLARKSWTKSLPGRSFHSAQKDASYSLTIST